jgi:hypothetical protein
MKEWEGQGKDATTQRRNTRIGKIIPEMGENELQIRKG